MKVDAVYFIKNMETNLKIIKIIPAFKLFNVKDFGVMNFTYMLITHLTIVFLVSIYPLIYFNVLDFKYLQNNKVLILFVVNAAIAYSGLKYYYFPGNYVPNKSFRLERLDKKKVRFLYIISSLITIVLMLYSYFFGKYFDYKYIFFFITFYYYLKTLKVHNDVDYVTNETIKDIIGIEIDDKIVASYQNFDGTKPSPQKNDNLIVVTYRKIFFTYYDGYNWVVLNKQIFELEKIGVFRNDVNSYLKLVFSDGTSLGLRLELDKKLTTNPQLFIKQFLSVLDSSLTGNSVDSPVKRRRVSLDDKKINSDKESPNPVRQIELNPELISEIKKSEKTASVRNIDI